MEEILSKAHENTEEEKDVVIETSNKEIIENYLNDPEVQKRLDIQAIHLNDASHGNWSTLDKLCKKSQIKKPMELKMILDLLIMSKRAFAKKEGEVIKYKITLNKDTRKMVLQNHIASIESSLVILKEELAELSK